MLEQSILGAITAAAPASADALGLEKLKNVGKDLIATDALGARSLQEVASKAYTVRIAALCELLILIVPPGLA